MAGARLYAPFTPRGMASGRGRSGAIKRGLLTRRGRAPCQARPGHAPEKGSRGIAGSGQGIRMGLRGGVGGTQGTGSWSRARFYELTFSLYMTPGSVRGDHLWSPSSKGNRRSVSQLQGCGRARNPPTPLRGSLSWSALCALRSTVWHSAVSLSLVPILFAKPPVQETVGGEIWKKGICVGAIKGGVRVDKLACNMFPVGSHSLMVFLSHF